MGNSKTAPKESSWQPSTKLQSFFEQIKRELFEEELKPPPMELHAIELEPEEEIFIPDDYEAPQFVEGSSSPQGRVSHKPAEGSFPATENQVVSLDGILASYNTIQQGIILREILGKPRAMQNKMDWFHN